MLVVSTDLPNESTLDFLRSLPDLLHASYEVVLLTKKRNHEARENFFKLGISQILTKPIDYQEIAYVVRNAAMTRARLRQLEDATLVEVDEANRRVETMEQALSQVNEKLEQNDDVMGMLAGVSHDFRTPLQVIVGFSDLLLGTHLSAEQLEWAESIRRSGGDIMRLVKGFLELQRTPQEAVRQESRVVNFEKLMQDQVQVGFILAGKKELRVSLEYQEQTPRTVLVDDGIIRRVVQNLLANAIKFTSRGSVTLKVEGRQVGQHAHLMVSVQDTGPGLDMASQEHVYERGVRTKESGLSGSDRGYGLGLAVCRDLMTVLGGKMGVESQLGEGARFWFKLKVPVVEEKLADVAIVSPPSTHALPPRVLVADDDAMSQKLVRRLLSQMGFGVELVQNGQDALVATMMSDFQAVIMDCDMPVMDGYEATRLIRERESENSVTSPVPIIALTGHVAVDEHDAVRQAGATAHVTKPVALNELEAILREHIRVPQTSPLD